MQTCLWVDEAQTVCAMCAVPCQHGMISKICRGCASVISTANRKAFENSDKVTWEQKCPGCLHVFASSEFTPPRHDNGKIVLGYYCYQCSRSIRRTTDAARRKPVHEFIVSQKTGRRCVDCGHAWPHYVLEFDHRDPREKSFTVSKMVNSHWRQEQWGEILEEISKCDLVCRNCHIVRSYKGGHLGAPAADMDLAELMAMRSKDV